MFLLNLYSVLFEYIFNIYLYIFFLLLVIIYGKEHIDLIKGIIKNAMIIKIILDIKFHKIFLVLFFGFILFIEIFFLELLNEDSFEFDSPII